MRHSSPDDMRRFWDQQGGQVGCASATDPNDLLGRKNAYIGACRDLAIEPWLDIDSSVLDFGCGTGTFLSRLIRRHDLDVAVGVDISATMLALATERDVLLESRLVRIDGHRLPFRDASFDVVTTAAVLQYLVDDVDLCAVLAEFRRVLKPRGRVVAIEQVRRVDYYDTANRKRQRAPSSMKQCFRSAGFELVAQPQIRRGHFPLVYAIRYGLVPARCLPTVARWERRLWANAPLPMRDYADVAFVFAKGPEHRAEFQH
ncbi:class I SAM-dependent methyltransferase [Cognatilysobacter lacus]|uniref:Methyltransferase domain-containing protein n=1 Tax=Cognatilysobacter lacus TaxID=1643323 RepID=A0A5D8Z7S3_9GAMM|nr:class I SAM-dependent methyltransferase [Lysobacter lacus]TZF90859.1 methyltransferase domain-containing protein [Lysobacter lacus]